MTRSRTQRRLAKPRPKALDSRDIDALYGLEPLIEPGSDEPGSDASPVAGRATGASAGGAQPEVVACPYCGESFETVLDLTAGSASYIEDCQVCCQPIQFDLNVDPDGTLVALDVRRGDD